MSVIVHVDMDCFFCACEVKQDRALAGKPVIVGSTGERGVVSAASYEARAFGVYSATPIGKARRLCPEGVFLGVDMDLYIEESRAVMKVFYSLADEVEQMSVDEAYLDMTEYAKKFDSLEDMGNELRRIVFAETGLSCSVGISESRVVSKIASDFKKPGGVTVVRDAREFLAPLKITKIPGIGRVSKEVYIENGINFIGDLCNLDRFRILELFGESGVYFQNVALGLNKVGLIERGPRQSIGSERTFAFDTADKVWLLRSLYRLCEYVHSDLEERKIKTVTLKIRYSDFHTITRAFTLRDYSRSLDELRVAISQLFFGSYVVKPVRLVGVKVSKLNYEKFEQKKLEVFNKLAN